MNRITAISLLLSLLMVVMIHAINPEHRSASGTLNPPTAAASKDVHSPKKPHTNVTTKVTTNVTNTTTKVTTNVTTNTAKPTKQVLIPEKATLPTNIDKQSAAPSAQKQVDPRPNPYGNHTTTPSGAPKNQTQLPVEDVIGAPKLDDKSIIPAAAQPKEQIVVIAPQPDLAVGQPRPDQLLPKQPDAANVNGGKPVVSAGPENVGNPAAPNNTEKLPAAINQNQPQITRIPTDSTVGHPNIQQQVNERPPANADNNEQVSAASAPSNIVAPSQTSRQVPLPDASPNADQASDTRTTSEALSEPKLPDLNTRPVTVNQEVALEVDGEPLEKDGSASVLLLEDQEY